MKHAVIHCNTLQQTAALYNKLQHAAIYCNILQYTATHAILKQQAMKHYTTPPHAATRCNTLQHTATHAELKWQAMTLCKKLQILQHIFAQQPSESCDAWDLFEILESYLAFRFTTQRQL